MRASPEHGPTAADSGWPDPAIVIDLERTHGQAMFGFVRRLGLTEQQAQDSVQEVLLRLWSQLSSGSVIVDPRGWAYRSVYRLAMDEHRLRTRLHRWVGRIANDSPQVDFEAAVADRIVLWREVDRLPHRQRQMLYLRYAADLAYDEIGNVLGITAGAARAHATFGTATLRRRLVKPAHLEGDGR